LNCEATVVALQAHIKLPGWLARPVGPLPPRHAHEEPVVTPCFVKRRARLRSVRGHWHSLDHLESVLQVGKQFAHTRRSTEAEELVRES